MSVGVRQHTQDICVCPAAHTGRLCEAVRECPCVSVSTHRTFVAVHQYTYQHIGLWTQHGCPSHGLLGTSVAVRVCLCMSVTIDKTSVGVRQHTQDDVRGCLWLSVSKHRMPVAVHVCPCVSVNTHWTSVAVHQYTYQHAGPWTQHGGPSRGLFG
ncbi:hypothetical protein IGI04_043086 [Brassica rapa subsp. trilocularis]|uniref:EGF-like domain-containing protein n=1 Tax=Brassica rapa subsp. trilocularis TaxID=1813537 RepID=A0ABQ7KJH2_BRACM|nr:hypothetical protein IGI04_043086 [Brassica rapa subsp. trilocularis]